MGARDGLRKVNPQLKVENPLQIIADKFEDLAVAGLVEAKDLKRLYNKSTAMYMEGKISADEYRGYLKAVLEEEYSSKELSKEKFALAYTKRSEIRKDLYEKTKGYTKGPFQEEQPETALPAVQINYEVVSEKIKKNEPVKAEHIACALTTLNIDLAENKIDAFEARKHLNSYNSLKFPKDSMEAKIREQLCQSYSKNFSRVVADTATSSAKPQTLVV